MEGALTQGEPDGVDVLLLAVHPEEPAPSAGLVTLAIIALGSAYDYPLRTPSLAVQFILALVWIAGRSPVVSNRAGSNARPRTETASNAAPAI